MLAASSRSLLARPGHVRSVLVAPPADGARATRGGGVPSRRSAKPGPHLECARSGRPGRSCRMDIGPRAQGPDHGLTLSIGSRRAGGADFLPLPVDPVAARSFLGVSDMT